MGDRVNQLSAQVRDLFQKMNQRTRVILGILLALTVAAVAGLVIWRATRPYAVLFTDLSSEDMATVLNYLESNNVTDYRVQNNDRILVPEREEASLRARILMEGYPSSGTNYQLYLSNVGALSSDSDRRQLQIYDLQNRLGATIKNFPGVRDAVVFITLGEDRRYILSTDDVTTASASVSLTMQGSATLTSSQAAAIRNLVSHAVQGLEIDEVSISDQAGNTYGSDTSGVSSETASIRMDLERSVNAYIRSLVLQVLEPMFGPENVSVTVNSTVDVSRRYEDSTTYQEPEWAVDAANGQGIIGRRIWGNAISRDEGTAAGGVVGTTTNADLNEYVINQSNLTGNEREISTSGQVDYNVDTYRVQSDTPAGTVTDIMVSVVINSTNVDVPATNTLVGTIARAAGIDAEVEGDKIAVLAYPFYVAPEAEPEPDVVGFFGIVIPRWVIGASIIGGVLFLILLIFILLLRRSLLRRRQRRQEEAVARAAEAARNALTAAANAISNEAEAVAAAAGVSGDDSAAAAAKSAASRMAAAMEAIANGDHETAERELNAARAELSAARTALVTAGALASAGPIVAAGAPLVMGATPLPVMDASGMPVMPAPGPGMMPGMPGAEEEPADMGADIMDMHTEYSMELRRRVRQFAEENPEIAAQMIRNWMRGIEDDANEDENEDEE